MAAKVTSPGEYAQSLLQLIFNATPYPNMADNAATAPFTILYVSLHTASPTATGNQSTSEAAYAGYARVAISRSTAGWTVSGNGVSPTSTIIFPTATGSVEVELYFGIGTAATGAGHLLYYGQLNPSINVVQGATPELLPNTSITEI